MIDKKFQPEAILLLDNLEALKTLADPLRNQIMEVLMPEPLTVNQIAARLGEASSKLYYHINMLERNGFIQVVDTTTHGNLIEKHYWITAYQFDLKEDLLNFNVDTPEGTEQIIRMLVANLDLTRDDVRRSMYARHQQIADGAEKNPREVFDTRVIFNLPDDKASEFHKKLKDLVKEFQEEEKQLPPGQKTLPWALSAIFYPSFYYKETENKSEGNQDDE